MSRRELITAWLCLALACGAGSAVAQTDPLAEVNSLIAAISRDSTYKSLLTADASVKWPVELQARTLHQKAVAGLAKGLILNSHTRFDASIQVLGGVTELLDGTSEDRLLAFAYYCRAQPEQSSNNIALGVALFERALHITARVPYPELDALLEKDIAWSYCQLEDYSQGVAHFLKALSYPMGASDRYHTLAAIAEAETRMGMFPDALLHIQQMEALRDSIQDSYALLELSYGELALAQGDPDRAIDQFKIALARHKAKGILTFQAWALSRLSNAYRMAGKTAPAIEYAREGRLLSMRNAMPKELQDNEGELYKAYVAAGNKVAAYDHFEHYINLRDSASGSVASGILAATMLRNQVDRQARTDSLLRAEKELRREEGHRAEMEQERAQRNIFLLASLALCVFGASTLRQRNKIRKARDRSDELLLNILPEEVAEELKEQGESMARSIDQVTVLFTDFKGFTGMAEKMGAQELVNEIDTCFRAFDQILAKRGVEKIKTIGDAYMAAGGMPIPSEDSARSTVLAALDMQDFMRSYRAGREAAGKPAFEMRIGIHTGPVVAGIVGVKKFQYDIWGDTVNTASRMESSGEVGRVNISGATYALVKDIIVSSRLPGHARTTDNEQRPTPAFAFTPRGKVQAKGKGEMEMYFVHRDPGTAQEHI